MAMCPFITKDITKTNSSTISLERIPLIINMCFVRLQNFHTPVPLACQNEKKPDWFLWMTLLSDVSSSDFHTPIPAAK